jgi:hypothetical protein
LLEVIGSFIIAGIALAAGEGNDPLIVFGPAWGYETTTTDYHRDSPLGRPSSRRVREVADQKQR